jgi:hypothetical protein
MRRTLLLASLLSAGLLTFADVLAQAGSMSRPGESAPAWSALTPEQREALAPLAGEWPSMSADSTKKWLDIAAKYPRQSPDGKARLHSRMAEFAKLTPEQRQTARENFQRAYELPRESRESAVQQYQALPPEKKKELTDQRKGKEAAKATASK